MVIVFSQNFLHIDKFSSTPLLQCFTETTDDGDSALLFGIAAFIHCKSLKYEITNIVCILTFSRDIKHSSKLVLTSATLTTVQIVRSPKFKKSTFWLRVLRWKTVEIFG
jgi:hypothetical protein